MNFALNKSADAGQLVLSCADPKRLSQATFDLNSFKDGLIVQIAASNRNVSVNSSHESDTNSGASMPAKFPGTGVFP